MKDSPRWPLVGVAAVVAVGAFSMVAFGALVFYAYRSSHGGWHTHEDEMGFTVERPADWSVHPDPGSGRVEISGQSGERVVAWPLYSVSALSSRAASALLGRVAPRLWPEARWSRVEKVGARAVLSRGRVGKREATCVLTWVTSTKGSSAFAYLLDEGTNPPAGAAERLARVAASFRLVGRARKNAPAPERFDVWTDPRERAFSVEIPSEWRADGGAVRPSQLTVQAKVEALSSDGEEGLYLGDAFPVYVEPNAVLAMAGIGPGGTYVDPMGNANPVAQYAPGIEYALRAILPARVGGFRTVRRANRPDVAGALARFGINTYHAGEAEYVFVRRGRTYRGWALCITERIAVQIGATWHVWRLYLVEAPDARFDHASAVMIHMAGTFRIDAQWAARQAQLTAAQSRIIADMGQAVSRTIGETHAGTQASLDEIHRRGANARREVDELVDPGTGRKTTVASGSNYYWVDDRGTIVGTDTDTRPSVDFRELTLMRWTPPAT